MLISLEDLYNKFNLKIKGVIHIGAHLLEEKTIYNKLGIDNIVWIEANNELVEKFNKDNLVLHGVISDKDYEEKDFIITNNFQSSSIFELGEHKILYPEVYETNRIKVKTITLDTLLHVNNIDINSINFINMDIQGAELLALKGAEKTLKYIDYLYLEVNEREIYKNCALLPEIDNFLKERGFIRKEELLSNSSGWGDAFYMKITNL